MSAFLAPVQQGSLAAAPAAAQKTKAGADPGPAAASSEAAPPCETAAKAQSGGRTASASTSASACSPGTASAAAAVETPKAVEIEKLGSCSEVRPRKDGGVGCGDDVDGRDNVNAKRSRLEGSDRCEEGKRS